MLNRSAKFTVIVAAFLLSGCASGGPKGFLKLSPESLARRQLQMRQYETNDEAKMLAASVGVLQDLGFILGDSETSIGFIAASKLADATDKVKAIAAGILDLLSALGGNESNLYGDLDGVQKVKASLIIRASLDGHGMMVRANFQRIVWSKKGIVKRVETIDDPEIYRIFFASLDKATFLDENLVHGAKTATGDSALAESARSAGARVSTPLQLYANKEYQLAVELYKAKDYDGAWRKAYAVLEADPQHWQSWSLIGNCQYSKSDREGALVSYQQSLKINPDNHTLELWVKKLTAQ